MPGAPLSPTSLPRPDPARGVFETLLVAAGRPVELDAHVARLSASARELFGDGAAARIDGPARALATTAAAGAEAPLARLRLTLAPVAGGRLDLAAAVAPVSRSLAFPPPDRGPALSSIVVEGGLGAHKWADRRLLERAARLTDALPLLVDADGSVLEAERANVFVVEGGSLVTPPADGRLLPGVARRRTIEIARELAVAVEERPVALADLLRAEEVLLTGSVRGVEAVVAVDGSSRRAGGPVTVRLATRLRERWLGAESPQRRPRR